MAPDASRKASRSDPPRIITVLVWGMLACAMVVPVAVAAISPWLAGRSAVYVVAGFAGIVALALMLVQPLLGGGYLPGLHPVRARHWHRAVGIGIVGGILVHVAGLYVTSPQDALDALLLVSPTPFSVYGVIGLWSVVLTALLVALRSRMRLRPAVWRIVHNALAVVVVVSTTVHAWQVEGTMGAVSKGVLCALVLAATLAVTVHLRAVRPLRRR